MDTITNTSSDWAHAPPEGSPEGFAAHGLDDHLRSVGALAASFAPHGAEDLCRLAGIWHDLGKRRAGFQRYIRQSGGGAAHIERIADHTKTHSAAGALWAEQFLTKTLGQRGLLLSRVLQYVIAGHHAGLDNWDDGLQGRLAKAESLAEFSEAISCASPPDLLTPADLHLTLESTPIGDERATPGRFALWLRMVFSALVDADFLDTEAYMSPERAIRREGVATLPAMREACESHLRDLSARSSRDTDTPVNRARTQILGQCRAKAGHPPGVFSLTVPTGGGKTLSSLAFALDHAVRHGKRRIVYAIPYTSIIEQTADVFRDVFAALDGDTVVEHHSNAESEPEQESPRSRLACENWDAPLVVTTNVQLFESLFARRTSRCRKLHNLADSVVVLDEAQLLPVEFLQPIVDVLRYLVQDFGVTVLLCTATQPGLDASTSPDPNRGLRRGIGPVTEIIDDVPALYRELERVHVHLPENLHEQRAWPDLADEIVNHEAVLAIVSRRADAQTLYQLLEARTASQRSAPDQSGCWHLSALMCAQHRSDTIAAIKRALKSRRETVARGEACDPVRVVSTQLVEAGVDLDFPVVFRALAGVDSIAQAAGRCNREGRLPDLGDVHVFVPPTEPPHGLLRQARDHCRVVWHDIPKQPFALPLIKQYFKRLYADAHSTDAKRVADKLKLDIDPHALTLSVEFRSAADAFKLIDDKNSATVLVRYRSPNSREDINALIGLLERDGPTRWLMRKLQRYGVTIYRHHVQALVTRGDIYEVPTCPGLYAQVEGWDGFYDSVLGARVDSAPGDPANYVA